LSHLSHSLVPSPFPTRRSSDLSWWIIHPVIAAQITRVVVCQTLINRPFWVQLAADNEIIQQLSMVVNFCFKPEIRIFIFENIVSMRIDGNDFLNVMFPKVFNIFLSNLLE